MLYDFQSANDDEMSVQKDQKIFIEAKTEHEGWLIARGRERAGLVPSAYVQLICPGENASFIPFVFLIDFASFVETGKYVSLSNSVAESQPSSTQLINTFETNNLSAPLLHEEADYFSDDD